MPSVEQIAYLLANKLSPPGALARAVGTTLRKLWTGVADEFVRVYARVADLIREAFPSTTDELLADWEEEYGLPDPCVTAEQTTDDRRAALRARYAAVGGQSRAYFISLAASMGITITISEETPFYIGVSGMGDRIGGTKYKFIWSVHAPIDLSDSRRELLECTFERLKPAHTEVFFYYEAQMLSSVGFLAGSYSAFTFNGDSPRSHSYDAPAALESSDHPVIVLTIGVVTIDETAGPTSITYGGHEMTIHHDVAGGGPGTLEEGPDFKKHLVVAMLPLSGIIEELPNTNLVVTWPEVDEIDMRCIAQTMTNVSSSSNEFASGSAIFAMNAGGGAEPPLSVPAGAAVVGGYIGFVGEYTLRIWGSDDVEYQGQSEPYDVPLAPEMVTQMIAVYRLAASYSSLPDTDTPYITPAYTGGAGFVFVLEPFVLEPLILD